MTRKYASPALDYSRVLVVLLGLGTFSGWATYFISSWSAAETARQLRAQVSSLHQIQMDLLMERDRMKAAQGDLEQLRSQVTKLRQEADLLGQARDLAQAELVTAATGMKDLISRLNQTGNDVSTTGSIDSQHLVTITAQKALTQLGYGPLTSDGVAGPSTRRAVEAFQRAKNLYVSGELDAPTLRVLTPGKGAAQ